MCVVDACFVIDWSRWRRRDLLWEVFSTGFVPEPVLREVSTPAPLRVLREWMAAGRLTVYPSSRELEDEAVSLVLEMRRDPRVPRIDPPEALCVVVARRIGAAVLSENRGILRAFQLAGERLAPAVVWNSLRLLAYLYSRGLAAASSFADLLEEYTSDARRAFSQREVAAVAREFGVG